MCHISGPLQEWSALDDTVKDIQASLEELAVKGEGDEKEETKEELKKEMTRKSQASESDSDSEEDEEDEGYSVPSPCSIIQSLSLSCLQRSCQ